ncbi:MAG: hypothetical protein ACR2MZ_04605 [Candidatus Dormibacter sp.]|nr:MAG: hypothetical protein DLM66_05520 [Candidatus Dormibacteraeota bacterium]
MYDFGDMLAWPMRDQSWVSKILLMGLICLLLFVPLLNTVIVVNLYGWVYTAFDNLRGGRQEIPPAGFGYIGRGVNPGVVLLLYGLVVAVLLGIVYLVGIGLTAIGANVSGDSGTTGTLGVLGFLVILAGYLGALVLALGLALLTPVILLRTYYGGIGAGLNLPAVINEFRAAPLDSFMAALGRFVGQLLGQVGVIACIVGVAFTIPYAYLVDAGAMVYLEQRRQARIPQPPPSNPGYYPSQPTY